MPTYKRLPRQKRKARDLPLYRPIDRLLLILWEKRRALAPFAVVALMMVSIYGALRVYVAHVERKGTQLLEKGEIQRVVEEYPRSKAANLARMRLGRTAFGEGRYDGALGWYQAVLKGSEPPPILRINALHNLALVYLKKGEPDRAVQELERAIRDPSNASPDYSRLLLARVYETKGESEKAVEIYKILSEGEEGPLKGGASERLKLLEPEGTK